MTKLQPKLTKKQLKATAFRSKKKIKDLLAPQTLAVPLDDDEADDDQPSKPTLHQSDTSKRPTKSAKPPIDVTTTTESQDKPPEELDLINGAAAKRRKRKKAAQLNKAEESKKKSKLILFVGNLPFDISVERLKSFFCEHCDEEPTVRLMTPKSSSSSKTNLKTKGCGFIEFQSSASLQKALRLHQTPISSDPDPSIENQKKARKINIELTAGGGGNSQSRQHKLGISKERLSKQREKRIEKSLKEATEKKLKTGIEDAQLVDGSIKLGSKRKRQDDGGKEEEGAADWGSKGSDAKPQRSSNSKSKERWKPQISGSNAIRLG